jgi:EAL domain-containing protein (putative c-di-GMP-specific phosphodiesterase class I)
VPGILSADFSRLVAVGGAAPGRVGVEISLLEAVADWPAFSRARARLAECGFGFVLDGVSHLSLLMTRPALLGADLVKLDWSPRLAELPEAELVAVDRALREIDLSRVVLHRAETEAALRWGMAHGIRRFQGRHVDAMLGVARIMGCGFADGCALRQCIERAGATSALGRAGCHNQPLLDAGAPANSEALAAFSRAEEIA